jgi:hypothetical protein
VDRFLALEKDNLLCKVSSSALRITQLSIQWKRGVQGLKRLTFNPLNAELYPLCQLLALSGAHHIFHVSGLRVKGDHLYLHLPHVRKNEINRADTHVKDNVILFLASTINSGLVFN